MRQWETSACTTTKKGVSYYHFESKQALASAIIDEGIAQLLDALRGVTESPTPAIGIRITVSMKRAG